MIWEEEYRKARRMAQKCFRACTIDHLDILSHIKFPGAALQVP